MALENVYVHGKNYKSAGDYLKDVLQKQIK